MKSLDLKVSGWASYPARMTIASALLEPNRLETNFVYPFSLLGCEMHFPSGQKAHPYQAVIEESF